MQLFAPSHLALAAALALASPLAAQKAKAPVIDDAAGPPTSGEAVPARMRNPTLAVSSRSSATWTPR